MRYASIATWIPESFPDFMCIGAPRAATTWLYARLRRNPQVFLPKVKELHFFDELEQSQQQEAHGLEWSRSFYFDMANPAHWRWYSLQFRGAGARLKGDITPVYSILSPERVGLIGSRMPHLKIIYIIRNPIDRAWSGLRKSLWYQKGKEHEFAQDASWMQRAILHPGVLRRGHYREAIETWSAVIPPSNILYLFYDDIVQGEQQALGRVYEFLQLKGAFTSGRGGDQQRINAAPALQMPEDIRTALSEYYRPQIAFLESRFNRDLRHWLPVQVQ